MAAKDMARPDGPGSREPSPDGLGPSGFDPSRVVLKVANGLGWHELRWRQLRSGFEAMRPGKGVDYFEAWDVAYALLPIAKSLGLNASYIAGRLLQRARKAGHIHHRGRGQWVRCDSNGADHAR